MVSSDMPEVIKIADRVYVMCEGKITGEIQKDEINELNMITLASPLSDNSAKEKINARSKSAAPSNS